MNLGRKLLALVGMLVMSLFTPAVLAGEAAAPDASHYGVPATDGNVLKNRNDCVDATFFKNVFPSLTNGGPGGSTMLPFTVDGKTVSMYVTWHQDNSVDYRIEGGWATRIGVTVDTNYYIYENRDEVTGWLRTVIDDEYSETRDGITSEKPAGQFGDFGLNFYGDGTPAADVNHLDLCLATLDTAGPTVEIKSPANGAMVSGDVPITATVSDSSGVDLNSVLIKIYVGDSTDTVNSALIVGSTANPEIDPETGILTYTWTFDSGEVDVGTYRIEVSARDGSILANLGSDTITVEVVRSIANCLGVMGEEDTSEDPTTDPFGGGCNPSGYVTVQAPPAYYSGCVGYNGEPCIIGGELLTPDADLVAAKNLEECDACGKVKSCGEGAFPDPRMVATLVHAGNPNDPDDNDVYSWAPRKPLEDLHVFALGGAPVTHSEYFPTGVAVEDLLVLDEHTYGYQGCFGVVFHYKNFPLVNAYPVWPQADPNADPPIPPTGLAFVKTVFPEDDWETPDRPVAKCYGEDYNFDLQESAEFAYQTDDKADMIQAVAYMIEGAAKPYSNECGSSRTLTRDKSFEVFNVIESDGIEFNSTTGAADVLEWKYQVAAEKFQDLFAVLDEAEPTLLTGRFSAVTSSVNQAKSQFENNTARSLQRAIDDLQDASWSIKAETTWQVMDDNWPGDALGRIENLIYRLGLLREELVRLEGL